MTRDELVAHLVASRIAGDVATPRQSNLANITKMLNRDWDYWFGLELDGKWSFDDVLSVMAERVGIDPDPSRLKGADRIDPALVIDALDAAATLLAEVVAERGRVLLATGHPTGILSLHLAVARALAAAGCDLLTPAAEWPLPDIGARMRVRYLGDVAMLTNGADFLHTHAPEPMQAILARSRAVPDLVIADHGYAGAAAQAGIRTIGFADSNDPALFVGAAEGKVAVSVPLDDNVAPASYLPVAAYLLARLGTERPPRGPG